MRNTCLSRKFLISSWSSGRCSAYYNYQPQNEEAIKRNVWNEQQEKIKERQVSIAAAWLCLHLQCPSDFSTKKLLQTFLFCVISGLILEIIFLGSSMHPWNRCPKLYFSISLCHLAYNIAEMRMMPHLLSWN